MIALIDSDILCHAIGFSTEGKEPQVARDYADMFINSILQDTEATSYECWLSDSRDNNFRHQLTETYKANRKQPKPTHYEVIKEHLVVSHNARIAFGMEADDMLAVRHRESPQNTIICSLDKDLDQIEGKHYKWAMWRNGEVWKPSLIYDVDGESAMKFFWKQMLMGDTADNIKCIDGLGDKRATKLLIDCETSKECEQVVREQYEKQFGDFIQYETNYKLLYILRTRDEIENILQHTN